MTRPESTGRVAITAALARALQPEPGRRPALRDALVPGLSLYVTPAGCRSWCVTGYVAGRQIRVIVGRFPAMAPKRARRAAVECLASMAHGVDPRPRRAEAGSQVATLGDLWPLYLEQHARPRKKTWRNDASQWKNHLSSWSTRGLAEITRRDVAALHVELSARVSGATANKVIAQLSVMFELAIDWGIFPGPNPARQARKARYVPRQRVVEADQFPALLAAIGAHPESATRDALLCALWTGARIGEVLAMRWDEIDVQRALWLIPDSKNGDPRGCHLTGPALEVLAGRRRSGPWVFPGRTPEAHLVTYGRAWRAIILKVAGVCPGLAGLHVHDLRRTMAAWEVRTGATLSATSRSLGHRSMATTWAVYAVAGDAVAAEAMDKAVAAMMLMAAATKQRGG
jgi:integrase